jgi:hypothetical protein
MKGGSVLLTLALAAVEAVRNPSLRWWLRIYVARDALCMGGSAGCEAVVAGQRASD